MQRRPSADLLKDVEAILNQNGSDSALLQISEYVASDEQRFHALLNPATIKDGYIIIYPDNYDPIHYDPGKPETIPIAIRINRQGEDLAALLHQFAEKGLLRA